jgi:hypothetical protein
MHGLIGWLWAAAGVQFVIGAANFLLPKKLNYREHLSRVSPIIRQVFFVHSAYIVGIVALFAVATLVFAGELSSGRGLGRFLASSISIFWLCRVPVQLLYYDPVLRRENRAGDFAFTAAALFLAATYGWAAFA